MMEMNVLNRTCGKKALLGASRPALGTSTLNMTLSMVLGLVAGEL